MRPLWPPHGPPYSSPDHTLCTSPGSATACVLSLNPTNGLLKSAKFVMLRLSASSSAILD